MALRIAVHLRHAYDQEAMEIADAIADLLIERGYNTDDKLDSLIVVEAMDFPVTPEDEANDHRGLMEELSLRDAVLVVPCRPEDF
jgi:hypothetical protein